MNSRRRAYARILRQEAVTGAIDEILLTIRNAVIAAGRFDRASVWYVREDQVYGTWGTDGVGKLRDEHCLIENLADWGPHIELLLSGAQDYYIEEWEPLDGSGPAASRLPHAVIALRAEGQTLGLLSLDNLLSGRAVGSEAVEALLPIASLAARALRDARRLIERARHSEQQRRLAGLAAAISAHTALNDVLRMVRDAVVEAGGFDRAAVFLYDREQNLLRGAWGTDRRGRPVNITRETRAVMPEDTSTAMQIVRGEIDYVCIPDYTAHYRLPPRHPMYGVRDHATLPLRAGGEIVGILSVDNLLRGAPITSEDIESLLPFAEQAAVAIQNARLLDERAGYVEQQRRLMEISDAINASLQLDEILCLVRNAVIEVGVFDRASVFLVENGLVRGAWGTDAQGRLRDEHDYSRSLDEWGPLIADLQAGKRRFYLSRECSAYARWADFEGAVIGLRADGKLLGLFCVDNSLTGRPVTEQSVRPLLPFAEQAALAVRNARLLAERARHLERQRRLAGLAAAISAHTALNDVLRMVRDAVVEAGGFDRAAVFLYDREQNLLRGAWGTDREGRPENIAAVRLEVFPGSRLPIMRVLTEQMGYLLTPDFTAMLELESGESMFGVHAHATLPLRVGGEIVGALCVDNLLRAAPITEEDVESLLPFTGQAAVAIQNARLFEELRQAQEALVRSEKLRAVGEMASGVAHNINNVLTAVLGYAELIQHQEEVSSQAGQYARIIERAALDGAEIVRRIQQFARKETQKDSAPFDLTAVAREAVDLTRPFWGSQAVGRGIQIETTLELPADLPTLGNASEIREVAVNLIRNATDAMPAGGTLTVRAYARAREAVLEVADTGIGMSRQTVQRVFEPFFTTKETTRGTGLGLSVAWGIIARHGGRIEVESEPGQGSLFRVMLPLAGECCGKTAAPEPNARLRGQRVLLVEDEKLVAASLERMLAGQGASVVIASSAAEALEWLQANAAECRMVLSDHGMAGMTGMELLARVRAAYPALHRVLLSGWGSHPPDCADMTAAEKVLAKPVRGAELAAVLAELLA